MVRSGAALFIGLLLVWLALSGHYTPKMVFLGVLSCVGVLGLSIRMGCLDEDYMMQRIGLRFPLYVPWLLAQIVKANLYVAGRILIPSHRISPTLVRIKALPRSEAGIVTLANSITLTPGTISVRAREGYILVHALTQEAAAVIEEGEFNRRVAAMEGRPTCTPSS